MHTHSQNPLQQAGYLLTALASELVPLLTERVSRGNHTVDKLHISNLFIGHCNERSNVYDVLLVCNMPRCHQSNTKE